MRFVIAGASIVLMMVGIYFYIQRSIKPQKLTKNAPTVAPVRPTSTPIVRTQTQSIFVPDWQLDDSQITFPDTTKVAPSDAYRYIYFGVTADKGGIVTTDSGYKNTQLFMDKSPSGATKLLTIKMTSDSVNHDILNDESVQDSIINDAVALARDRGFSGIVMDLELAPTLDGTIPAKINHFVDTFHTQAAASKLTLGITMYGDNFYRRRPYDLPYLVDHCDEILVMAYDLHKPSGEPGPNMPLKGREHYGYDLTTMIADFGAATSKLTVVYGMYGYDWVVDENKRPFRRATSATLAHIQSEFLANCAALNCTITRDPDALEQEIDFIDKQAVYHVVWYEDIESAHAKTEFLNEHGVKSIAYWAYGYF